MSEKANVLRDMKKRSVHAEVFCSTLKLALWYKALSSERSGVQAITKDVSGESKTEGEENKIVDQRPLFVINNSA